MKRQAQNNAKPERRTNKLAQDPNEDLQEIELKIEKSGSHDLAVLESDGWPRKKVLSLLAITARGKQNPSEMMGLMRKRRDAVTSLARKLRTIAPDLRNVFADPLCRVQWWAYLSGGGLGVGMPRPELWNDMVGMPLVLHGTEWAANALEEEGKKFGQFLRRYGHVDTGIALFLTHCWFLQAKGTQKRLRLKLNHLNELARLLTDAFEYSGSPKQFSADQLRQVFNRHGRRMIRLIFEFSKPAVTPVIPKALVQ